jgi:DNA-binding transcriptional LysR family regulator
MLNPTELNVFSMAAETENFSETARRLGVSQPTVSTHVKALEERLGIQLFARTGRTVMLTEAGRALMPLARDLIQRCIRVEETMRSLDGRILGTLQIGCTTAAGKYVLPRLLGGLRERHPEVDVVCKVTNRRHALELLSLGEVQIAVTSLEDPARDFEYQAFATDRVVLIVPPDHPWAGFEAPIPVERLQEGRFIVREEASGSRAAVAEALARHGMGLGDLPTVMELGNAEAIRMAVSEGIGVAFVSALVAAEGGAEAVSVVPVRGFVPKRTLWMVRDVSRPATRAQEAFWEHAFSDETADVRARIADPMPVG